MKGIFTILNYYFSPGRRAAQWPLATAPAAVGDRNLHFHFHFVCDKLLMSSILMMDVPPCYFI